MARPTTYPEWAKLDDVDPTSGQNNVVEPPAAWKDYGWSYQEKPPRNYDNWFKRITHSWIEYLDGTAVRPATKVVAASDATQASKDCADYLCNGTNDEVEISAAIAAVAAAGGGSVMLTEGTFTILDSIAFGAPGAGIQRVLLFGQGKYGTTIRVDAATASDFVMIQMSDSVRCSVRHMRLNGNGSAPHLEMNNGIEVGSDMDFDDLEIVDLGYSGMVPGYGFSFVGAGVSDIRITNCDMQWFELTGDRVVIANCRVNDCAPVPVHDMAGVVIGDDCTISGCVFHECGILVTGNRARVIGCLVTDAGLVNGIHIKGAVAAVIEHCVVFGCVVEDGLNGIVLEFANHSIVQGCSVSLSGEHGIFVNQGDYCAVVANTVRDSSRAGDNTSSNIYVFSTKTVITSNVAFDSGGLVRPKHGIETQNANSFVYGNCAQGKTASVGGAGAATIPEWISVGADSSVNSNVKDSYIAANRS